MIKFLAGPEGEERRILGLGLSEENWRRLRMDRPILIDLTELGFTGPTTQLLIIAGETEDSIIADLRRRDLISPDAVHHDQRIDDPSWPR